MGKLDFMDGPLLCVGGPLDGDTVRGRGSYRIEAVIPDGTASAWGLLPRTYVADILRTSYEIREFRVDAPGIVIVGAVYAWIHNKNTPAQLLMQVVAHNAMASQSARTEVANGKA